MEVFYNLDYIYYEGYLSLLRPWVEWDIITVYLFIFIYFINKWGREDGVTKQASFLRYASFVIQYSCHLNREILNFISNLILKWHYNHKGTSENYSLLMDKSLTRVKNDDIVPHIMKKINNVIVLIHYLSANRPIYLNKYRKIK